MSIQDIELYLGNVLVTISDKKIPFTTDGTTVAYYSAEVLSAQDYYPFGMLQPGRNNYSGKYRYGFNGKENDKSIASEDYDYGARIYDARISKFLSLDPLSAQFPMLTPYQYASNSPVALIDIDGKEGGWELSTPKHNLQTRFELESKLPAKHTNNPATSSAQPVVKQIHSEAPPAIIQQAHLRVTATDLRSKNAVAVQMNRLAQKSFAARVQPTPSPQPANEFEAGAVQGTYMAMYAVTAEYCPGCAIGMGIRQMQTGIQTGDALQTTSGAMFILGGVTKVNEGGMFNAILPEGTQVNGFSFGKGGSKGGLNPANIRSVTNTEIGEFISTEPYAQGYKALSEIQTKLNSKDLSIWSEPIFTTTYKNKTYVLDGNHRLTIVAKSPDAMNVTVQELSEMEATFRYPDKMKDIRNGNFNVKMKDNE